MGNGNEGIQGDMTTGLQKPQQPGIQLLLSFRSLDCGKIWRAEWSYTEAWRRQVFRTMEMLQCRVRTQLQLMCCTLTLELGVLISEQKKVAGKGDRVMV